MSSSFPASVAFFAFAVIGLTGCHSDAVSPPNAEPNATSSLESARATAGIAAAGGQTLVVDNDRLDCPRADYTSIQAAATAADPGSTILVCPGTYLGS